MKVTPLNALFPLFGSAANYMVSVVIVPNRIIVIFCEDNFEIGIICM